MKTEPIKLYRETFEDANEELISNLLNDPQKKQIKNLIAAYVEDLIHIPTEEDQDGFKREFTRGSISALRYLLVLDTNARIEAKSNIEEALNNLPQSIEGLE